MLLRNLRRTWSIQDPSDRHRGHGFEIAVSSMPRLETASNGICTSYGMRDVGDCVRRRVCTWSCERFRFQKDFSFYQRSPVFASKGRWTRFSEIELPESGRRSSGASGCTTRSLQDIRTRRTNTARGSAHTALTGTVARFPSKKGRRIGAEPRDVLHPPLTMHHAITSIVRVLRSGPTSCTFSWACPRAASVAS